MQCAKQKQMGMQHFFKKQKETPSLSVSMLHKCAYRNCCINGLNNILKSQEISPFLLGVKKPKKLFFLYSGIQTEGWGHAGGEHLCSTSVFLSPLLHTHAVLNFIFYGGKTWISVISERSLFNCIRVLSTLTCTFQICTLHLKIKTKAAQWFKNCRLYTSV